MNDKANHRPILAAGTVLGLGLGGFLDGILFHQILQWHGMLTEKYPRKGVNAAAAVVNLEVNMFWDGLFHVLTWILTAVGVALLWRAGKQRDTAWNTKVFVGSLPLGWGLFNLVEGIVNHHVLQLHHVVEGPQHLAWDIGYLLSGVVLIVTGIATIAAGRRQASSHYALHPGRPPAGSLG